MFVSLSISVSLATFDTYSEGRCNIRTGALIRTLIIRMGALIGIGALINKNTFDGGCLFGRGRLLEGGRKIESLR